MPNIVNAVNCPPIQQPSAFISLAAASSGSFNAPGAPTGQTKDANFTELVLSPHASMIDILTSKGGANACCIAPRSDTSGDFALTAPGSGVLLAVAAGEALIGTILQFAGGTVTCSFAGRNWIWLQQTGALLATTGMVPPTTLSCLLGSAVVAGSNITSVDTSGVLYLVGGVLVRYSGDAGIATDAPPASVKFRHITPFASFDWEGLAYRQIYAPSVTADPTSVQEGLTWFRSDTLTYNIYSVGAVHATPVMAGTTSAIAASVLVITPSAVQAYTTPAALTEIFGTKNNRAQVDLTNATQMRIVTTGDGAGSVPPDPPTVTAYYSLDGGTTWTTTGVSVVHGVGTQKSAWISIPAPARADVLLGFFAISSGGVTSWNFGGMTVQAR